MEGDFKKKYPLIMVGSPPTKEIKNLLKNSNYSKEIHFLNNVYNDLLKELYQGARVFLFPSLEEGFGWPIAEAMASGCPVITTEKPPMTEVGGDSCYYIPPYYINGDLDGEWSKKSAKILQRMLNLDDEKRKNIVLAGIENAKRFDAENSLTRIESIYKNVLKEHLS
jgi:glycosyltransferase involved in cell wall biosynthesis